MIFSSYGYFLDINTTVSMRDWQDFLVEGMENILGRKHVSLREYLKNALME